ncbi:hypothetical protein K458DRAFT_427785 [Lentithecium fluviatile CBS 122367]|uniref:Zincin n=1 Tax=Lentithecium fluviatile CBS 122367 TaxID=1168545 RepID=A0A6G1JHG1_9PLEO|nr:hypothetical protein K458DRAFT_427785 [Lentithecium fluviatile CBS 122367]
MAAPNILPAHLSLGAAGGKFAIRVGDDNWIPRWARGVVLTFKVDRPTFPSDPAYYVATSALIEAARKYNELELGVRLKYVDSGPAVFKMIYRRNDLETKDYLEHAFFPGADLEERVLVIFSKAFKGPYIGAMVNIFYHALGHIFGLRHEFAHEDPHDQQFLSVLFGAENTESFMNYFENWREAVVTEQDARELKDFYALGADFYEDLLLVDVNPEGQWM